MKRFRNFFCPRCLRANRDTPGNDQQGAQERSDFFPVHTGFSFDDDKLQNLRKKLDIELRVKEGAENLLLAYCRSPITKQKTLNAVQKMHEKSVNKIQALRMQILQEKKQRQGTLPDNGEASVTPVTQLNKVSVPAVAEAPEMGNIMAAEVEVEESLEKDAETILETFLDHVSQFITDSVYVPAVEETPEMGNIMPAGLEVEESPEKDAEAILEIILDRVFELVPDTLSVPALEEAPEMDNIMPAGLEVEESPEMAIESIVESILDHVSQLVTDSVYVPAVEEAPEMGNIMPAGLEVEEYPEMDIEVIVESILEQVFEMVTDASCVPALAEAPEEEIENVSEEEMDKQIQDLPSSGMQLQRKIGLQDFRCCAMLGRGSYGKVLLAECKTSKQMVALKALKKSKMIYKRNVYRLMREKEAFVTTSSDRHPFLVNLIASFQTETHTIFAMEYAAGGDLKTHLNNTTEGFPKSRAVFYAACVILGLECLHRHNIVHRDLKASNIVLDQEGFAKITDFGLCKPGMGFGDRARSRCGTVPYMAPELLTDHSYTRAVDWWSVGALIYTMLVGRTPFTGNTDREIKNNIVHAPVSFPKNVSKNGAALLRLLLDKNPTLRLGASEMDAAEVKEHLFFRKINWTKLLDRKMKPPFLPVITSPEDVSNFSKTMTSRAPILTPPCGASLTEKDQEQFEDFDWIAE